MIASGTVANAAANGRVVGDAEVAVDDRADQLWLSPPTIGRDEVAEREREREDRAGDDAGERERQHDACGTS